MAIVLRHTPSGSVRCSLCGCASVNLDYWEDPDGEASLELGQCPRCDHRWTRPLGVLQPPATSPSSVSPVFSESSAVASESSEPCPGLPAAA